MITKDKETYIAPSTTFCMVQGEGRILQNVSAQVPEVPGEEGEIEFARDQVGFDDDSFDFGDWDR